MRENLRMGLSTSNRHPIGSANNGGQSIKATTNDVKFIFSLESSFGSKRSRRSAMHFAFTQYLNFRFRIFPPPRATLPSLVNYQLKVILNALAVDKVS